LRRDPESPCMPYVQQPGRRRSQASAITLAGTLARIKREVR
jgi:hypothetical protein